MVDGEVNNPTERPTTREQDEVRLAELGYKQELMRDWSLIHNFGVSFSIIVSRVLSFFATTTQVYFAIICFSFCYWEPCDNPQTSRRAIT